MAEELNEVFTLENKEMNSLLGYDNLLLLYSNGKRNNQY